MSARAFQILGEAQRADKRIEIEGRGYEGRLVMDPIKVEVPAGKTVIIITAPQGARPEEWLAMEDMLAEVVASPHERVGLLLNAGWKAEVFGASPTVGVVSSTRGRDAY